MSTWWDPTSWALFSDYGASAWAEDIEEAVTQAETWVESAAIGRGWSQDVLSAAVANIQYAATDATDAGTFWGRLVMAWDDTPTDVQKLGGKGWTKLRDSFASAAGTAGTVAKGRDAGSVGEVIGGTVEATEDDLTDMAAFAKKWGPWIVLVIVILGVIAFAATRK